MTTGTKIVWAVCIWIIVMLLMAMLTPGRTAPVNQEPPKKLYTTPLMCYGPTGDDKLVCDLPSAQGRNPRPTY